MEGEMEDGCQDTEVCDDCLIISSFLNVRG